MEIISHMDVAGPDNMFNLKTAGERFADPDDVEGLDGIAIGMRGVHAAGGYGLEQAQSASAENPASPAESDTEASDLEWDGRGHA